MGTDGKEFYENAIKEMEHFIELEDFLTAREFGKMAGLERMTSKREMIAYLRQTIHEYKVILSWFYEAERAKQRKTAK